MMTTTASRPVYDGSQYGCDYDEYRTIVIRDQGSVAPGQHPYAYAGYVRSQPEMPKPTRLVRDATDNWVQAIIFRLSTRIPSPMHAIQSRRRHINSIWSNRAQLRKLQWKRRSRYTAPLDIELTDRDLLPSQRQRMQDLLPGFCLVGGKETALDLATAQMQPSSNSCHWDVLADGKSTSSCVKISRVRVDEIIRQRAGTLKRNIAVRRSRRERTQVSSTADAMWATSTPKIKRTVFGHNHVLCTHKIQRRFSFEDDGPCMNLSAICEQTEQGVASKPTSMTRVDSGAEQVAEGRSTRFREESDQLPCIARTFSEILGHEPFVPTALLDCDEQSAELCRQPSSPEVYCSPTKEH
ncbi:uncharacterized protein EKO05_0004911 [Ascochyta rabiei]|uniref:Uncharacterized protein n=1 Tax=Didymella rabiei TaxID=5454 RepID=A0A163D5F0_DIDRA|nr:uncharacterized protein EKO05_0004911 [Ascochyta rabiei]KZM22924.1 hypothetical protein ST47_g5924 [Ascochyta rabiei]UPX14429.1 hypothetical protein EKO05_0004911 [Ascochyta rabiei]